MRRLGQVAALVGLLFGNPIAVLAEGGAAKDASVEALLVEFADTPAQHRALAEYFRGKAAESRKVAADHRSMGKHYAAGKLLQRDAMKAHCDGLAQKFDEAASDYERLAADHEAEAKGKP